jgi:hypothetical protein
MPYIVRMTCEQPLQSIADDELLCRLVQLLSDSRRVEADLVAHIGEVDRRRLYARQASPSMFVYCTQVLHLSEAEAYLRINAARAAREHPVLLTMLEDGRVHLSGIVQLAPHLTPENRDVLLERASYRSKREIEELLAEMFPRPDAPALMRKLPERRPALPPVLPCPEGPGTQKARLFPERVEQPGPVAPTPPAAFVLPLSPARYKVQFTASAELHGKLERLQALMRSKIPDGDLAAIIEEAVSEKLVRLEARLFGAAKAPRTGLSDSDTSPGSRHIPAAVKRVVSERDGRRCRYEDEHGRRCSAREGLQYHHRHPFALGGGRDPANIILLCATHNGLSAEHDYGATTLARQRHATDRQSPPPSRRANAPNPTTTP